MKFKVFIISALFVCSMLPELIFAQNKVVVIPLMPDCEPVIDCNEIQTVTSAGQVWMDRNLGAVRVAESVDDYFAYGFLYQWGRLADGHETGHSPTTATPSGDDDPNHGNFITANFPTDDDWRFPQNDNLWQGVSGDNNPCPAGFRLPTETEWETERASWSSNDSASAFASPLKLVVAGYRSRSIGTVYVAGSDGYYWSSTVSGSVASQLNLGSGYAYMSTDYRAFGFSVRCLKD